jgi:hypothetical protein
VTVLLVLILSLCFCFQVGFTSRKVNRHVDFPFVLDLAPFCSFLCQGVKPCQKKILYSLYGVVEHSGRLNAGHYTAYVKVRPNTTCLFTFLEVKPTWKQKHNGWVRVAHLFSFLCCVVGGSVLAIFLVFCVVLLVGLCCPSF